MFLKRKFTWKVKINYIQDFDEKNIKLRRILYELLSLFLFSMS